MGKFLSFLAFIVSVSVWPVSAEVEIAITFYPVGTKAKNLVLVELIRPASALLKDRYIDLERTVTSSGFSTWTTTRNAPGKCVVEVTSSGYDLDCWLVSGKADDKARKQVKTADDVIRSVKEFSKKRIAPDDFI